MQLDYTQLPLVDSAEVVVVGSGSAGSTAAIASARMGADTLLLERYGFLGGTSTMILDTFYGFYTPGDNTRRVVGGIPWEIAQRLAARGMMLERPSSYGAGTAITYDPETLKVVWEETAEEAGVRLRLHTFCTDVLVESGRITGLIVDGKSGLGVIKAKMFVDATGDADVCFRAGVPFQPAGEDGPSAHETGQSQWPLSPPARGRQRAYHTPPRRSRHQHDTRRLRRCNRSDSTDESGDRGTQTGTGICPFPAQRGCGL